MASGVRSVHAAAARAACDKVNIVTSVETGESDRLRAASSPGHARVIIASLKVRVRESGTAR